jgi:hypothetical protein
MPAPSSLTALLQRWQELQEHGQNISAEDLCADTPELLAELRSAIQARVAPAAGFAATLSLASGSPGHTPRPGPGDDEDPNATRTRYPAGAGRQGSAAEGPPEIPGYEILGELGRGGMGVVYHARQTGLNRPVALKMILAGGHAGSHERARFRAEAEAVARLQHPNIVQVHEIGEHGGLPFFSLEYCPGGSLAQKLQGRRCPRPRRHVLRNPWRGRWTRPTRRSSFTGTSSRPTSS